MHVVRLDIDPRLKLAHTLELEMWPLDSRFFIDFLYNLRLDLARVDAALDVFELEKRAAVAPKSLTHRFPRGGFDG